MPSINIDVIILMIATAIGFITYSKKNPPYLRVLPFFLLFDVIVEFTGQHVMLAGHNNVWIFNLYSVVEFSYFLYYFRQTIYGAAVKKKIRILQFILPVLCLVNIFFIQGIKVFHTYSYVLGSLLMVGLGVLYFYRLFKNREQLNLLREPSFWISIGVIFFYVCALSTVGIINYIAVLPRAIINNMQTIIQIEAAFFYLFYIIAFLCRTNTRKS
jgi:hypothetical protein